ncbi:hypothetical protein VPHK120G1_0044 [Vibrio phage K120 g1]
MIWIVHSPDYYLWSQTKQLLKGTHYEILPYPQFRPRM